MLLTFVNCEGYYLAEGFLHSLCSCFNTVLAQLRDITKVRNKFVEIVAASERYLIKKLKREGYIFSNYTRNGVVFIKKS